MLDALLRGHPSGETDDALAAGRDPRVEGGARPGRGGSWITGG